MITYEFPITVNLRKFLPSADRVLGEIEATFKSFTGENIGLVATSQVMVFTVKTPVELTREQINLAKARLYPLLVEHFPNQDIEIGEPTVKG